MGSLVDQYFSLLMHKWGIFALVESLEQSHFREFCVTQNVEVGEFT